jgi:hypothetical protein
MNTVGPRELYEAAAKEKDMPILAVMVADYFNAPVIHSVDLSAYNGNSGEAITISASDDISVVSVHVTINDEQGNPIESGDALETAEGSGKWVYTTTTTVASDVNIQAVARDLPGGVTVQTVSKSF